MLIEKSNWLLKQISVYLKMNFHGKLCAFYAILGGAVYVYYNSQDGLSPDRERVRLVSRADRHSGSEDGFEAREGRFGLSVSGAGDLNADGAQVRR